MTPIMKSAFLASLSGLSTDFYNLLLKRGKRKKKKKNVSLKSGRCKVDAAPRHWINSIWTYPSRK